MKYSSQTKAWCARVYLNYSYWRSLFLENSQASCDPLPPLFKGFHRFWQSYQLLTTVFWSNSRSVSGLGINPPDQCLENQRRDASLNKSQQNRLRHEKNRISQIMWSAWVTDTTHGDVPPDKSWSWRRDHAHQRVCTRATPAVSTRDSHRTHGTGDEKDDTGVWRWEDDYFLFSTCHEFHEALRCAWGRVYTPEVKCAHWAGRHTHVHTHVQTGTAVTRVGGHTHAGMPHTLTCLWAPVDIETFLPPQHHPFLPTNITLLPHIWTDKPPPHSSSF